MNVIKELLAHCPGCGEFVPVRIQVNDYRDGIENLMVLGSHKVGSRKACKTITFARPLSRQVWTTLSKRMADDFKKANG